MRPVPHSNCCSKCSSPYQRRHEITAQCVLLPVSPSALVSIMLKCRKNHHIVVLFVTGAATLNIFSMTCYNVDVNVDWGCSVREFPLPGDNLHFNNILQSKFSNLLTFDRFVGSVCYCRRTDCTDVINGSSTGNPPIIATLLFSLFFILGRKFYF